MRSEEKQEIFCIINNIKELQHLVNAEWEDHFQKKTGYRGLKILGR